MTENKRFTLNEIDNFNYGIKVTDVIMDDGIELPQSTVCDLLNDLSTENDELRQELNCEKPLFTKKQLHQENQKLTEENKRLKHEIEDFQELLAIKEREEFLKPIIQQIEEARERERTTLGKSVIQQLLEQIQ